MWCRAALKSRLAEVNGADGDEVRARVAYYNQLNGVTALSARAVRIGDIRRPERLKVYYFDSQEYLRYFNPDFRVNTHWGDVTFVPDEPAIVKSRPIVPGNENSVLLNLDKVRHFNFIHDRTPFREKKDMLIGRAHVSQEHRIRFYQQYFEHPLCDLGQINKGINPQWIRPRVPIAGHLDYKFILSLEGNDVASNLKWVMSSNSLAVMPTPRFETWFMEATLIPDYHYVHIKDDYSDLEAKLRYYIDNPEKAESIIRNAHQYVNQFRNRKREELIALLVLDKYFICTGQQ